MTLMNVVDSLQGEQWSRGDPHSSLHHSPVDLHIENIHVKNVMSAVALHCVRSLDLSTENHR